MRLFCKHSWCNLGVYYTTTTQTNWPDPPYVYVINIYKHKKCVKCAKERHECVFAITNEGTEAGCRKHSRKLDELKEKGILHHDDYMADYCLKG